MVLTQNCRKDRPFGTTADNASASDSLTVFGILLAQDGAGAVSRADGAATPVLIGTEGVALMKTTP